MDTADLKDSQSLVIVDDQGKRWDVAEALASSDLSSGGSPTGESRRATEVILERWCIELKTRPGEPDDFGHILPTVYKKAIVFFRTLFLETRISPCWNYTQHSRSSGAHPSLRPRCRIKPSETESIGPDTLRHPLYNSMRRVVDEFVIGDLEVPVGRFYASVAFRRDVNFRVDDSEKILSSRFMGAAEELFKPSVPQSLSPRKRDSYDEYGPGRRGKTSEVQTQTYGSLSTFHGIGPLSTSPMSALRAMPSPDSEASSRTGSPPNAADGDVPHSMPVSSGFSSTSRQAIRAADNIARRPSISFQSGRHPFKAGSVSTSPAPLHDPPSSPRSQARAAALASLTQARNRTSLTAGMPASLRNPTAAVPTDVPMSSSPRPTSTSRYSSSFTHRRGRLSFSSTKPAVDDDQGSSGRQSVSSSVVQPGSGLLAEAGAGGSSGSFQTDDENISDFLKHLDTKKSLKSFEPTSKRAGESVTNRTVAQLSKFHMMKESNNQLTESMTSSMQMHRSSSSSSRQLTSVPGMAPASLSASSSPGKPLSPHTPHTPAVPSRLSENSIIDYNQRRGGAGGIPRSNPAIVESGPSRENTITQEGTTAIDIPVSPRLGGHNREQPRSLAGDDEGELGYTRRGLGGRRAHADSPDQPDPSGLQPAADIRSGGGADMMIQGSAESKASGSLLSPTSSSPFGRRRYVGMPGASAGRGQTPPQSSRGSYSGTSSNRYAAGGNDDNDEYPLLFDMSEMDAARKSLEEARGGGNAGSASGSDRGGLGAARRGWS